MIDVNLNAELQKENPKISESLIHSFVFSKTFDCHRFPLLIYLFFFTPLLDSTAANALFTQRITKCCIKAKIQCRWIR